MAYKKGKVDRMWHGLNPKRHEYTAKHVSKYPCPRCGNDDTADIIRLRNGLRECRLCKMVYTIDELDDKE